jgi:26S proteasome regulatory subunit N5
MKLSKIKEADGDVAGAAETLHELQVETYGSMDRKEKVEFILEQMRLSMAKKDYIYTAILAKKISVRFFEKPEVAELRLKFYNLMVEVGIYDGKYLEVSKNCKFIFDTESVQDDKAAYTKALAEVVVYLVLSPYDNEQSDMVARVAQEAKLADIPKYNELLQGFIAQEILPWGTVDTDLGPSLKATPSFDQTTVEGKKRYEDLRRRVVEHNIRVMSKYYSCIKMARLTELLELPQAQVEEFLSDLVVHKTVYAKMDRPNGIVSFRKPQDPTDVLQAWSSEATQLMNLVDRATHLIEKEKVHVKA